MSGADERPDRTDIVRATRRTGSATDEQVASRSSAKEWLVTNGLGGYASGRSRAH